MIQINRIIQILSHLLRYRDSPPIYKNTLEIFSKGQITDLCAFMSETTNLCKTLQIYVAFIKNMHDSNIISYFQKML